MIIKTNKEGLKPWQTKAALAWSVYSVLAVLLEFFGLFMLDKLNYLAWMSFILGAFFISRASSNYKKLRVQFSVNEVNVNIEENKYNSADVPMLAKYKRVILLLTASCFFVSVFSAVVGFIISATREHYFLYRLFISNQYFGFLFLEGPIISSLTFMAFSYLSYIRIRKIENDQNKQMNFMLIVLALWIIFAVPAGFISNKLFS